MPPERDDPPDVPLLLQQLSELRDSLAAAHERETRTWEAKLREQASSREPSQQSLPITWHVPNAVISAASADAAAGRCEREAASQAAQAVVPSPPKHVSISLPNAPDDAELLAEPAAAAAPTKSPGASPQTSEGLARVSEASDGMTNVRSLVSTGQKQKKNPMSLKAMVQQSIDAKKAGAFELRRAWDVTDGELDRFRHKGKRITTVPRPGGVSQNSTLSVGRSVREFGGDRCVVHPQAKQRLNWDLAACFLLAFDLVAVPMQVFDLGRDPFIIGMEVIGVVFWALDIVASFFTGIYIKNELELRMRIVARAYVRSWFAFDICLVLAEIILAIMEATTTASAARTVRTARFLRMVRYLRIIRLVRLVKFKHVINDLKERTNHEAVLMAISLSKLCGAVGIQVHILACGWYAIGDIPPADEDGARGWIYEERENGSGRLVDKGLGEKYLYSFQFSLARLHPSNMKDNMELQTLRERFFSIFATMGAMVVASVLISHLTNRMAEVKSMRAKRNTKLVLIKSYALKHNISQSMILHLKKYINTVYSAKIRGEDEAELMQCLPNYMLADLRCETFLPQVEKHPFFAMLDAKHKRTSVDACFRAMSLVNAFHGEHIFVAGDSCTRMLFVRDSRLIYEIADRGAGGLECGHDDVVSVEPGQWLSEAALWTSGWENCGQLSAVETCVVVAVESEELSNAVINHSQAMTDVVPYARTFLSELNDRKSQLSDLSPQASHKVFETMPSQDRRPSKLSIEMPTLPSKRVGSKDGPVPKAEQRDINSATGSTTLS